METQFATDAKRAQSQFISYLSNPQHWSRYSYALNNPLLYTDPDGEDVTIYYRPASEGGGGSLENQGHILIYVRNDETGESRYFDYTATDLRRWNRDIHLLNVDSGPTQWSRQPHDCEPRRSKSSDP